MHVKSIRLREFRGFTSLDVIGIPESARLVMLIGPNGTGKSSLFDALLVWSGVHGLRAGWDADFHVKKSATRPYKYQEGIESIELHEPTPADGNGWNKLCYFRSAYRNEPDFEQGNFGGIPLISERRFHRTIDNDAAVSADYRRLVMDTISVVFGNDPLRHITTLAQYADGVVKNVNDSLAHVLPHLQLESLGDPTLRTGNFYFTKGIAKGYLFKNLSGGEKAVFDLLIDLITKSRFYDDSILCIDEPEAHVNPAVQAALLRELVRLTPPKSQLWIATHAIGMLRCARDIDLEAPGSVCFINFEANFDRPVALKPMKMDRATWQRSLAVALGDLAALMAPKRVVICEGGAGARFVDDGLDGQIYNRIFAGSEPDTVFFSSGSHTDTEKSLAILTTLSGSILPGLEVRRLIDRDDRSDAEVAAERAKGHHVLSLRNLESYLFSDEVIILLCASVGRSEVAESIIAKRAEVIRSKGYPVDDFKRASGEVYIACKRSLDLTNPGNTTKAFMIETLAPLLAPQTETFRRLRDDAFGAL